MGIVLTGLFLSGLVSAGPSQVRVKREELRRIQSDLESARREIEELRRLEHSLGEELHKIADHGVLAREKKRELERRRRLLEERQTSLRLRLGSLGQAESFWFSALGADLRRYVGVLASRDEAYGKADLWAEALRRQAIFEKAWLLAGLKGLGQMTRNAEAESRGRARELMEKTQKVEAEQKSREVEYKEKKAAIAQAQVRVAEAQERVSELAESARALTQLISNLSRTTRHRRETSSAAWNLSRNSLPWPTEGSVVRPFGRQRTSGLNAWVIHQGILLETRPSSLVASVGEGSVIFTGPFRSYGQVMILDHGSNFFTIYGGLGEILKLKGAEVRSGEIIARTGRRGNLYLEIRRGAEALDPLLWLKKK
jgi:septal ring factor EnvC (AmiA/AmiB activator)